MMIIQAKAALLFTTASPPFFTPLTLTSGLPAALANPSLPHIPAGRKGEGHGKEQKRGGEMRTL